MDEKKREDLDDVITVVEDYDDFQTLVKERKKNSEGAATAEDGKVKKESSDSDKKAASDKKEDSEKKEVSEKKDALDSKKDVSDKKESSDKKDVSDKKEASDKKDVSDKKEASDKKDVSDKKEASDKKDVSDKKEASDKKETSDKKDDSDKKADNTSKNNVSSNKQMVNNSVSNEPFVDTKTKSSGAKKGILIGLCIIAVALIAAYVTGFVYFSNHFYQYVSVNGIDVSGMDSAAAKNVLDAFYKNYKLEINTINSDKYVIDGKDIDSKVTVRDSFDELFQKQEPYLWFVNYFNIHEFNIDADGVWDQAKLDDVLSGMDFLDEKNMVEPQDAYIGIDDGRFSIIKEVMGSTINRKQFDENLKTSLASVQSKLDLLDSGCYKLPNIYSDNEELVKEYDAKKEYAQYVINIKMDDLLLEPGMDLYDAVLEKKGEGYEISKAKVAKYVFDLAEQYDTMGKERTFTTSFNDRKITTNGTAFGYELNRDETADALYKALTAGRASTVEAVWNSKGKTLQGENDIGSTYVEVNLSEQRVIAYKNGRKVAEGDCVSGNESAGHGTTTGLYAIQDKLSPTVLRGEKKPVTKTVKKKNKKGKKVEKTTTTYEYEYESPVTYWLQFNGGQGLHDAAGWRSAYGGSIYYYSGSHGCVNLPLDLAKTLYQNFEVGDPVIVYFWDNKNRK